ncbi:DUF3999 family protein [Pontibacter chitinilyticus]|uniref:DUF3999 family protein n=1 Tax=Pontibacter chitinilyticus TaxID=2674989 RepID=UPI00321A9DE3
MKCFNTLPLLALLLLFCGSRVGAQAYTWQAPVSEVPDNAYYRILLSPEVAGKLKRDFSDLRLYAADGKEVPYLLRAEQPVQYKTLFKPYQILSYTHRAGCCSELLIANPQQRRMDNLSLLISNADVQKKVQLSGSDNQQDWYVLKAQDVLYASNNTERTAEVKLLNFPLNNYRFLRLQINDSASAPLHILKAGYYDMHAETGKYSRIPTQEVTRTDSAAVKKTYLRLHFAAPVYPERLVFDIQAPQLYYRAGSVTLGTRPREQQRLFRRRKQVQLKQPRINFILSSNAPAVVELPREQVQELTIEIDNGDNPPLDLGALQVQQLNRYVVAALQAGQPYTLYFGNPAAKAPKYDLQFFQDSIPRNIPVLLTGPIMALQAAGAGQVHTSTVFIWAAIAAVALGLGYMTLKLLREMDRKKQ